ncbi:HGxxPAAW family protein [uncultured Cellulomonas sp.]|uniref:HGxxPAAW family protein n=1 Tax=uncultured Cellulomonas sp. TaxID=189682 RepID=UPI0026257253|nr:HGxxPAAW family protein [uncultured Cellulomonas sp.]
MADRSTSRSETAYLPPSAPPMNHGHTTAAWTMTVLVIVGFTVGAVGMVLAFSWLFWTGVGLTVLGVLLGKILQLMGFGQGGDRTRAKEERAAAEGRSH